MLVVMMILTVFLAVAVIAAIVTGLVAISPVLLLIVFLPILDFLTIRWFIRRLFRRTKKTK